MKASQVLNAVLVLLALWLLFAPVVGASAKAATPSHAYILGGRG